MGCCESVLRVVLGSSTGNFKGSGNGGPGVELGDASGTPFTMHRIFKGKDVRVAGGQIAGDGLALGCAPVEQDSAYWFFRGLRSALQNGKWANPSLAYPICQKSSSHILRRAVCAPLKSRQLNNLLVHNQSDVNVLLRVRSMAAFCDREVKIESLPEGGIVSLGVSRRPPPDDDSDVLLGDAKIGDGEKTWGFCTSDGGAAAEIREGDVIGVALDFTDLPMLFFSKEGAPLGHGDELAVMRIRGTVYPAVGVSGGAVASVAFAASSLAHAPPRKCQALVVGQDMM